MLGGLGAFVGAIAIVYAAGNFQSWVRREKFKADRERAIEIAAIFEEGRFVISQVRAPFANASEIYAAEQAISGNSSVTENSRQGWVQRAVVIQRIQRFDEFWSRLFKALPVAQAVFGQQIRNALFKIIEVRQSVYAAAEIYPHSPGERWVMEVVFGGITPTTDQAREIDEKIAEGSRIIDALMRPFRSEERS